MRKDYGPWVRHEWCPRCCKHTEQTRWHRHLFGEPVDAGEYGIRCNECASDLTLAS